MLFNSLQFLAFFAVVTLAFAFINSKRAPQIILLGASLYFYACWSVEYVFLMLFSVAVTFASGIAMERFSTHKKLILTLSLVINLAILFFFKYYNFFADIFARVTVLFGINSGQQIFKPLNLLLPVGISFYTFQALGYSIDVYRGKVPAERDFIIYALFVTFFPQLVAGPIERSTQLLPQFRQKPSFDYERVVQGALLATWGLFKKVCIADNLAPYVDLVYGNILNSSGIALAFATLFFAFQILCDFSGYSDIAIGIAKILGFNLMRNFNHPYFASSIADFWRRWHISLSTWFKDYIYIPLGGNRRGTLRKFINLFVVFFASGLWHGASLHFVAWGLLHASYQVVGQVTSNFRRNLRKFFKVEKNDGNLCAWYAVLQKCITFALVCVAWVLFRVNGLRGALQVYKRIAGIPKEIWWALKTGIAELGLYDCACHLLQTSWQGAYGASPYGIVLGFLAILLLLLEALFTKNERGFVRVRRLPVAVRYLLYWALFYSSVIPLVLNWINQIPVSEFVYFQF